MEGINNFISKYKSNVKDDNLPPKFICKLCDNIMGEVKATKCCHRFCGRCITEHLAQNNQCPDCDTILNAETDVSNDFAFNFKIGKLLMTCPNRYCDIKMCIAELSQHVNICTNIGDECTLAALGCDYMYKSNQEIDQHLKCELTKHFGLVASKFDKFRDEIRIHNENLSQSMTELTRENMRLGEEVVRFKEKLKEITKTVDDIRKENTVVMKTIDEMRKENAVIKQNADDARKDNVVNKTVDDFIEDNSAVKRVVDGVRKENADVMIAMNTLLKDNVAVKIVLNEIKKDNAVVKKSVDDLKKENANFKQENLNLKNQIEKIFVENRGTNENLIKIEMVQPVSAQYQFTFINVGKNFERFGSCHTDQFYLNRYKFVIEMERIFDEDTYIIFYVCLHKGEFDDVLSWPLKSSMELKIVDSNDTDKVLFETNFSYDTVEDGHDKQNYDKPACVDCHNNCDDDDIFNVLFVVGKKPHEVVVKDCITVKLLMK